MKPFATLALAALLAAGCASFDGRGLAPGKSTGADVEAAMGAPAARLPAPDGGAIWYYPRQPLGRQTFAARFSKDGVLRSVEPLLVESNIRRVQPGVTTAAQAREILGPPFATSRVELSQRDVWEYRMYNDQQWEYFLFVQLSYDGVVREVMMLKDYTKEMGEGGLP